ncbi:MAG TPA: peptidoglycan-binding domain-containing protein [Pyrinomonadaceae bacterium]|nr:peptidoglycan-binding domain-containing protein [Pyrinomonadaceae bacterium]
MARLLYYGCSGNDVKALQFWLNYVSETQRKSYLAALDLSGEFEGYTFRRVVEFQWFSGMESKDGVAGPKTRAALANAAGVALKRDGSLPPIPGSTDGQEMEHRSNRW